MKKKEWNSIFKWMFPVILMTVLTYMMFPKANAGTNNTAEKTKNTKEQEAEKVSYQKFLEQEKSGNIAVVYLNAIGNDLKVYFEDKQGKRFYTDNPHYDTFRKDLLENGVEIKEPSEMDQTKNGTTISRQNIIIFSFIVFLSCLCYIPALANIKNQKKYPASAGKSSQDKNNRFDTEKPTETFEQIAGLKEVKKDMKCLVDFIKNNKKYTDAGAELPRGVILYGPPGTGKTSLARAVAGEAGVPFHYMSGADFVEMFVGVGPKRVRELFKKAKKNAPCIIFIDEIDAIGTTRNSVHQNSEDRKTLNALLAEMDGFTKTENILVIGATNRLEDLDPALLRPGRFTNKYCVPLPETPEERMEIITLYAQNKKFAEEFNFGEVAKETIGCSPADIKSMINEAAIISVQEGKDRINREIFEKALMKSILNGHIKEDQNGRSKEELKLVAYHEAGHALIGKLFEMDVTKVTILRTTSGAGGVTFTTPDKMGLYSMEDLKKRVIQLYGGRAAEFILYGQSSKVTTGASNDIEKATEIIHRMIAVYGMTEKYGPLNLESASKNTDMILEEEINMAKRLENEAVMILKTNQKKLEAIAETLLQKETLYSAELDQIISNAA